MMSADLPDNALVTLRSDVVVEPLVARWYAWTHLISPATTALNVAFRHLRLMDSFVEAPEVHEAAARNPALRGGPFLDQPAGAVAAVRALADETRERQARQIAFGEALRAAVRMVAERADGHAMEALYPALPDPVRGYAELVYTIGGAPDLRVIEPLLYRSPVYDPSVQGAMLHRTASDLRAFALSTPRLHRADAVELERPFADGAYDLLARLRSQPRPAGAVLDQLGLDGAGADLFRRFLVEAPAAVPPPPPAPGATRWRYFGHACVLVEAPDGTNALVDPIVAYECGADPERFTLADLPERIDYVLLTHNHQDHVLLETLLALRWKIGTVVVPAGGGGLADPSLKLALEAAGFARVVELESFATVGHGDLRLTALPFLGEHSDLDIRTKAAWLVEAGGGTLLFAADSNNLEPRLYDLLRPLIPRVDALFIGMECAGAPLSWLYGPLLPWPPERARDQSRRLNGSDFPRAMQAIRSLGCDQVFVYAMGMEPWLKFISSIEPDETTPPMRNSSALVAACEDMGIPAERLYGRAEGWL